jgi:hypothetical protein
VKVDKPQRVIGGPPAGIRLAGVARTSPLARNMMARLDAVSVCSEANLPHIPVAWRRMVAGTDLQWWDESATRNAGATAAPAAALVLDLHGHEALRSPHVWRVVDSAGHAVLSPFVALDYCWQAAGMVSLFLIESRDGGATWIVLSDMHLSGSQSYRSLIRGIGAAVPALIDAGFSLASRPREWRPARRRARKLARLGYLFRHLAARGKTYLMSEVWAVGILHGNLESLMAGGIVSPKVWLQVPEREGYIADPFPWPGRSKVFLCERYHHRTGLGSLQSLTIDGSSIVATDDLRIDVETHLSYPFTFEENGRIVCLPEMGATRRQVMYELRRGEALRPICVVAENIGMADATLFRHDGRYFIAYTDVDIGVHDNLCLLWADGLEGPWTPHLGNPVKIDVRSSRGGGIPFRIGNRLVRPAQDCAHTYGAALVLNDVIECTEDRYREEPIARLVPDPAGPFPAGLHTLSFNGETILVDGKKFVLDLSVILQRTRRHLTRLRSAAISRSPALMIAARKSFARGE